MFNVNVLIGPTSSGKTTLALKLCKKFDGVIVSADSRQVFRKMDVGTGKMPINSDSTIKKSDACWVFDGIEVYGYDLVDPDQYFSAYDYAAWALPKIEELLGQGKNVFLVGGTGFFLDFVTGRVKPSAIPPNFELRKDLEKLSLSEMQKLLTSLNPEALENIDSSNPARLMRAIEIETSKEHSPTPLPYLSNVEFNLIGLTGSREILYSRVDSWLNSIWENGLLPETSNLILLGFSETRPMSGLIYSSTKSFLNNEISEAEAKQQAKNSLHGYIRRQQTYFKKIPNISWFDISDPNFAQQIEHTVQSN